VINNSLYSQNFFRNLFSSEKSIQELNKLVSPAVVEIANGDYNGDIRGYGSGFIVRENGVIVTNFHVIDGAHYLGVKIHNKDIHVVTGIIDINPDIDFAIIKINAKNLPVVSLGNSQEVEVGDKIVAIGSPQGLTNTISDGIVSGKRQIGNYSRFQITAPIAPGSSGGVLLNMYGDGIGITTSGMGTGNLNFAIPIHHLRKLSRDDQSIRYSMERFASIYGVKPPPKPSTNRAYQAQDTYTNQSSNNNGSNFLGWCFWLWIIWGLIPP
jgi:S1-C subfamily serine protease|tara:strand:- start:975 stop:1778 length:804 start_codon:yes stop_codon:yes gene_type:complete